MCYFLVMNDFGFTPKTLIGLILKDYYHHNEGDKFDPNDPFFGNTNVECVNGELVRKDGEETDTLDWLFTDDLDQDPRMGYLEKECPNGVVKQSAEYGNCLVNQFSRVSKRPVCWTTEALKYAQTSFFISIVLT